MNSTTSLPSSIAIPIVAIVSIIWVLIGLYFSKRNTNFDDHALAGRNVGFALGSATAVATWITSNTILLAPQLTVQLGVVGMLAYCTASFGLLLFAPMAQRIRTLMPEAYTAGDFMRLRYGTNAWAMYMLITLFYSLTWLVSMAMAGGILLESLSAIPYAYGMTILLAVCVLYTINGGLSAVIGTDFAQSIIVLLGVVLIGYGLVQTVDLSTLYGNLNSYSPELLNFLFPAAIIAIFNNLLFGLGEVFHNNVWWSRAFAMRDGVGRKAFFYAGFIWLPIPIAAGFIGLASGVLQLPLPSPDLVGPSVAAAILGKSGAIVFFIVVFCSLASSIDSLLASLSDLVTEDLYRKFVNPKASTIHLKKVAQRITCGIGVLVWLICLPRLGTLLTVLFFAGPFVGSLIWPIITGLYWRTATSKGAISGMLLGSSIGLAAYFIIGWYVATLVATVISMLCVLYCAQRNTEEFAWIELQEVRHSGE